MSESSLLIDFRDQPGTVSDKTLDISRLGFVPFIIINALVLIRPQEMFPFLEEYHLYESFTVICLLIYWPRIFVALWPEHLRQNPITLCVIGLAPLVVWSLLWHARIDLLLPQAYEFVKILMFYLILVVAVDTPARLRRYVLSLSVIISIVGLVALGHHLEWWKIDTIQTLIDKRDSAEAGTINMVKVLKIKRMLGVGIFADPNDLAQILAVGMVIAVFGFELSRWAVTKALWVLPMIVMCAGIYYTQSRGGLLAMFAGVGILILSRFGLKRAMIVGAIVIIPLFVVFAGRQTSISTDDDSTQTRVQLWSDSLELLRYNLAFGVGPGVMNEEIGQVSHNSFLTAFAETGYPGGLLFFSAYAIAIWGVLRVRLGNVRVLDAQLDKLAPALAAALVAYMMGMMSLTRNYVIPTYLMLGLATVYLRIVRTSPAKEPIECKLGLLGRMFALSMAFLLLMHLFVRASVRWKG